MSINDRIVLLLEEKGLKQVDLCKQIDVPRSTLNNWLKLGRSIPAEYIIPICEFLGVSIEYLLTGKESKIENESQLSDDEKELFDIYRSLDSRGKTMVKAKAYEEMDRMTNNAKSNGSKKIIL